METNVTFWRMAYQQHGAAVMAFLTSRVRHREDAEDLLHETFVRAIRAGERLRERDKVKSYLFTIAHRLTLDHRRLRQEQPFSQSDGDERSTIERFADPKAAAVEERAAQRQVLERVLTVLPGLSEKLRRAFELGVIEKRSYLEVAELTGWSLPQVKVNIHRARKRVLEEIGPDLPASGGVR